MRRKLLGVLVAGSLAVPALAFAVPRRDVGDASSEGLSVSQQRGRVQLNQNNVWNTPGGGAGPSSMMAPGDVAGPGRTMIDPSTRGPLNDVQPGAPNGMDIPANAHPAPAR